MTTKQTLNRALESTRAAVRWLNNTQWTRPQIGCERLGENLNAARDLLDRAIGRISNIADEGQRLNKANDIRETCDKMTAQLKNLNALVDGDTTDRLSFGYIGNCDMTGHGYDDRCWHLWLDRKSQWSCEARDLDVVALYEATKLVRMFLIGSGQMQS